VYKRQGLAEVQNGAELFIVANLVRPLQALSPDEVENLVVESLQQSRRSAKLMPFNVVRMRQLRGVACDMAKKDSLKAELVNPYVGYVGAPSNNVRNFTFTTFDPGTPVSYTHLLPKPTPIATHSSSSSSPTLP